VDPVTISFRRVRFAYRAGITVLDVPALDIEAGLTLLLGENGAGKTTLMRLAAGVERPDEGTVAIGEANLWTDEVRAREPITYVPEQPDLTPYATLSEILSLVARLRKQSESAAVSALAAVGLASLGDRTIRELSQGQRRRAVLGAAMIGTPRVLILDEPLESLDAEMRRAVLSWVHSAIERGATVLGSTHDVAAFERKTMRVLHVYAVPTDGRLSSMCTSER
jgi:ABC-type multidrug transport system ATPase subunit